MAASGINGRNQTKCQLVFRMVQFLSLYAYAYTFVLSQQTICFYI